MGSPVRIAVLGWSDTVADYGLFMLMTYLTEAWSFNFRHAAAIVNVFWGFVAILPIGLRFLKTRKHIPDRWMLFISSLAYLLGLGLLTFSSPKSESGKMDSWEAEYAKYGVKQETLLYASLPLIVIAKSGYAVSLKQLITDEIQSSGISDKIIHFSLSIGASFLVNVFGYAMSYAIKEWVTRFGIPALCMVVATLVFLTGFRSYGRETTQEPSLYAKVYNHFHMLLTDIIKRITFLLHLFIKIALCPLRLCCCCFSKKAEENTQEQLSPEKKTETITRVEETKFLISLFPICLLGLVSSLGNTYFLEQAYSMDRKIIGNLKVPLVILLSVYKIANYLFPKLYFDIVDSWIPSGCTSLKKALHRIGMALSLLCALLCCVIAAEVESKRIGIINKRDHAIDINQPAEMNLLYLVPQFFLLGGFFGMAYESIERFFKDHEIPASLEPYMVDSAVGVFGLGNIGSVLLVYLVSKCTWAKEGRSWFNESINTSRLDKYYWLLSVWTAINIVWYLFVSLLYRPKEKPTTPTRSLEEEEEELCPLNKLARKYCIFLKCLPEKFPDCCCCCCCCWCCSNSGGDPKQEVYNISRMA
ncbi:protein NRT1/ PTR FAMILY 5.5-like [Humulus lupulus]|uniref:protein NRT1/ PTR FAMILY 5.5-like n=1 Tax=Humulus lupulus TaxID=3486 RepID=UPI002B412952|nr:protein NRT1/ PTR FAMILY 5.5-like [Humulus lupulus]